MAHKIIAWIRKQATFERNTRRRLQKSHWSMKNEKAIKSGHTCSRQHTLPDMQKHTCLIWKTTHVSCWWVSGSNPCTGNIDWGFLCLFSHSQDSIPN